MSKLSDVLKKIVGHVAPFAPVVATALGGPGAGAAVRLLSRKLLGKDNGTESEVEAALANATPEQLLALKQVDLEFERSAERNAAEVNATMRAEAQSERWPAYSWRPAIGFAVALLVTLTGLTVFVAYLAAMWFGKADPLTHLPSMIGAMAGLVAMVSPILGIASWFRGKQKLGAQP